MKTRYFSLTKNKIQAIETIKTRPIWVDIARGDAIGAPVLDPAIADGLNLPPDILSKVAPMGSQGRVAHAGPFHAVTVALSRRSRGQMMNSERVQILASQDAILTVSDSGMDIPPIAGDGVAGSGHAVALRENPIAGMFAHLLDWLVDEIAEDLGEINVVVDELSDVIFNKEDVADHQLLIRRIGCQEDRLSTSRDTLLTINRMIGHAAQADMTKKVGGQLAHITAEISDLGTHIDFLSNKLTFLLDATLGLISITQNDINKIFSVASVIFLPPTLVASIYGMNFQWLPFMNNPHGFWIASAMMVGLPILTAAYFKRKGWL